MSDWDDFVGEVTWFVRPGATVAVGEAEPWGRGPVEQLPQVSALLAAASRTPVTVDGRDLELLAWGPAGDRRGWLCLPPVAEPAAGLDPVHRGFLGGCGGIVERFGEPDSFWQDQNAVLTESAAETDVASTLDAYAWAWTDEGLEVPIDAADYYAVAVEANGNLTLVHRETSQVVLFAPDHAFDGVTPLPGCPEYSLMTFDDAPDLTTWIETAATAWSDS